MGEARKICLYYIFGEKHTAAALVSENVEAVGARVKAESNTSTNYTQLCVSRVRTIARLPMTENGRSK